MEQEQGQAAVTAGAAAANKPQDGEPERLRPGMLGRWLAQGARTAVGRHPQWHLLQATPAVVALLAGATVLEMLVLQRLFISGPATFYWQAVAAPWLGMATLAWVCHLLRRGTSIPTVAHLLCMALAQGLVLTFAFGVLYGAMIQSGVLEAPWVAPWFQRWGAWAVWGISLAWSTAAQWTLLWRGADTRRPARLALATLVLLATTALLYLAPPPRFWYAAEANEGAPEPRFALTQEVMEAQPSLLSSRLQALRPQRPDTVEVYALTFAPEAQEDVFMRESAMVAEVMEQRFDASGRTVQLVNNLQTLQQWPWATPLNLRRAIQHIARTMDREQDILFIHLTSHGARDGELAASHWPLSVSPIKPAQLKAWLDEAGIRHRVISISACYAGSWIKPLSSDYTLVMTAADADHTSYGCGRRSPLTFFGRAVYDEQLRRSTRSFEQAHRAARSVIRQREEEAGKTDGYSNPQIKVGSAIRPQLALLEQRLARESKPVSTNSATPPTTPH